MDEKAATRTLSLHHLVAPDVTPCELVRIASDLGCPHVCLFTQDPAATMKFPVVTGDSVTELLETMQITGVTALGLAAFALAPGVDVGSYRPALELGARLGGSVATVRIVDPDEERATARFGAFAELCAEVGIVAAIEFMGFADVGALGKAVRMVRSAGRGKIALDALHAVHTGTPLAELQQLDSELFGLMQLCDGPLIVSEKQYWHEGPFDRLPPGEGQFPLLELLALIPPGMPISLEVPCDRWRLQGIGAYERARRVVEAGRRLLATIEL